MRRLLSAGPLRLPSRCSVTDPQQLLLETRRFLKTAPDSRLWKGKVSPGPVGFERNLATAIDDHRFGANDIPFDRLPPSLRSQYQPGQSSLPLYHLKPIDPQTPLVVSDRPAAPPRSRLNVHGVPGDMDEMLSIFYACLQIGNLDRAALVLKRFGNMDILSAEEMMELHARWLQARVAQIAADPGEDAIQDLHNWFELQVRKSRLPIDTNIIAYMLKASLLTSVGSTLKKHIHHYMSLLPRQAAMGDLYVGKVLTDQDLATIAQLCPAYSMPEGASARVKARAVSDGAGAGSPDGPGDQSPTVDSATTPQVRGTPQKGLGLESLKTTLSLFSELPEGLDIASLPLAQRREIQARLEKDCIDAAVERWRKENEELMEMGLNTTLALPSLSSKLYDWHKALEARLVAERKKIDASEAATKKTAEDLDRCIYGPYIYQSSPSRLAAVTILTMFSMLSMYGTEKGVPVARLVTQLAKIAEEDIRIQQQDLGVHKKAKSKQHTARQLIKQWGSPLRKMSTAAPTDASAPAAPGSGPDTSRVDPSDTRWPLQIRAKVGAVLASALIETARITVVREHPATKELVSQSQSAFSHSIRIKKGKKVGMVLPNQSLVELMKKEPRGEVLARHLPMLVEPEPWTRFDKGGFIESSTPLVRLKNHEHDQKIYAEAAIERGDMEQMCKGLDVLGKTAWKINRRVFDVMLETWNSGEALANIPALNPEIPLPPEPDSTDDPMKRSAWLKALREAENEKAGLHSVRCFMNFQLEIARAFRDQTFYFPHNLDFRGRAYPVPTYLNHMGADHMRGLLVFAKGKPLGENGLRWLKVHLANVFGFDKASLQEREDFTTSNLENIYDSADNPLSGRRWWLQAEDPWQCLATCIELRDALSSPDPAAFVSHLPVHQDGTCNGLQHYAALGGDTWGAQQVNLIPGERPADVYSAVAKLVEEEATKDAEQGHEVAKILCGKVTRKVVKQTVMTNVYGVTFVGAKRQVGKQLDALYPNLAKETGIPTNIMAAYIATKIAAALSNMFKGAHEIQGWLGEIGGRVCRAVTPEQLSRIPVDNGSGKRKKAGGSEEDLNKQFRSTLVWTTPLRMPVVQPYRKLGTRTVSTCLQVLVMAAEEHDDPVNRRKQLQAFPPNFIHSLDASHMMLSALECHEIGLTFAAVHDSFWTHAADVDAMNAVIRDSFIRIHSEDVIGRLKAEFEARYRGALYLAKVDRTSKAAQAIIDFRKERKLTLKDELFMEKRRQDLLRSMDPEEVREGKEMLTPASIFEALATPDMVLNEVEPEDLEQPAVEDDAVGAEESVADAEAEKTPEMDEFAGAADEALAAEADEDDVASDTLGQDSAKAESIDDDDNGQGNKRKLPSMSNYFVQQTQTKYRARQSTKNKVSFWVPLTFPDIPKKGDFDVSKLRDSKYFFS